MVTFQTVTPGRAASEIFKTPSDPAASVFSASQARPEGSQLLIRSLEKDIQRIQGFKTQLSPSKARRLAEIRAELQDIKPSNQPQVKALREAKKIELNTEAYKILGKKFVDIDADPTLKQIKKDIDALLEPPLRGEKKARLERLRKLEQTALAEVLKRPGLTTLRSLDTIVRQILILTPPRLIGELSSAERREYDRLVAEGNAHAGTEVFLPSKKELKIERIQATIARLG